MPGNLLEQLNQTEVPPPPREMERDVHRRVNQWLLFAQVADLVLRAFLHCAVNFMEAVLSAVEFSLTGKYSQRDGAKPGGNTKSEGKS